jgi:hypothetical protein
MAKGVHQLVGMWQCAGGHIGVQGGHVVIFALLHRVVIVLSCCHVVTLLCCHVVALSCCHVVVLSHCHVVVLSHYRAGWACCCLRVITSHHRLCCRIVMSSHHRIVMLSHHRIVVLCRCAVAIVVSLHRHVLEDGCRLTLSVPLCEYMGVTACVVMRGGLFLMEGLI